MIIQNQVSQIRMIKQRWPQTDRQTITWMMHTYLENIIEKMSKELIIVR